MPRFDNLAVAALTPGGAQAGVNDIVQAILGADAAKARSAAMQQQSSQENDFRERSLGARISNDLANQDLGKRRLDIEEMNAKNRGNKAADPLDLFKIAEQEANMKVGFYGPDAQGWNEKDEPIMDIMGRKQAVDPQGKPLSKKSVIRGPVDPKNQDAWRQAFASAYSRLSSGGGSAGQGIANSLVPAGQPGPMTPAPAPSIDYNAIDARLQKEDPQYMQYRSNPNFDWKAAIDAMQGQ